MRAGTAELIVNVDGEKPRLFYLRPPINHGEIFKVVSQIPGVRSYSVHLVEPPVCLPHQSVASSN